MEILFLIMKLSRIKINSDIVCPKAKELRTSLLKTKITSLLTKLVKQYLCNGNNIF